MTAAYRLGPTIQRTSDGAWIPGDPRNTDWKTYQAWLTAGGVPDPYVPPPPPPPQPLTVPGTGSFFSQNGAIISRIYDRVFIGPAALNDGAYPYTNLDWLSKEADWTINGAQLGVLSKGSVSAIVAGARTSDGSSAITTQSWVVNDDTTNITSSWAYYGEGRRKPGAGGITVMELDSTNQADVVVGTPYGLSGTQRASRALWLASGGGAVGALSTGTLADSTMALGITQNGAKFVTGIMVTNGSLTGNDAIALAQPYRINWYTGAPPATPVSAVGSSTTGVQLISNGVTAVESHAPATGETGLLLAVNRAGTTVLSQVKLGAPNSGGTGLRALVVDN